MREERLVEICRQFNVVILYVFGSRGKEVQVWLADEAATLAPGPSDVDVAVKYKTGAIPGPMEKVRLMLALEDFLDVDRVDLVVLEKANPFLAANATRGERLFADNDYAADEYELYVWRREADSIWIGRKNKYKERLGEVFPELRRTSWR